MFFRRAIGGLDRELDPAALAIFEELRGVEIAFVEQIHVGGAIVWVEAPARHELVEMFAALVVARINRHAPIAPDGGVGAFVLLAAKRCALFRRGTRIMRIDLDDPTVERGPVWIFADAELRRRARGGHVKRGIAMAQHIECVSGVGETEIGRIVAAAGEHAVEVFFRR